MTDELTTYELADGIAIITLDDGKVNALSPEMRSRSGRGWTGPRPTRRWSALSDDLRHGLVNGRVCGIENRLTGSRMEDVPDLTDVAGDHQPDAIRV